ncbi:MAG TPA: DUF6600 domain-containing protein [Dinghuibacter sp.]|uniref:DUF6600 domain-containing protein n=1 Tax=Dinghuibacter sp. TaxID=2024697 RepID=UPI002BA4E293|nr:DUF6600 domain-containing protein [Dinghuibacter sp.]HTJ12161.1 DUF6600 domain-containing protein [Dinghuibacter sp.]
MKKMFSLCALAGVCLAVACGPTHVVIQTSEPSPPPPAPAPPPAITYQTFYDALSPYGEWTDYPDMGYVWIPNVGPDFKPYGSAGQWAYSDDGWTWVSDYSWGWAPFHYGRWFFDDNYGWCWVPGYEWAPAWVSWRTSPDYYGWAPLGPAVGVSVSIGAYNPPPRTWCFVPRQYVASPHVNNYYVNESRNVTIINNTTVINNYTTINNRVTNRTVINNNRNVYVAGPSRSEVETVTRSQIRPVNFRESNAPGGGRLDGGQLTIYRPPVRASNPGGGTSAPAPSRVAPFRGRGGQPAGGQPGGGQQRGGQPASAQPIGGGQPQNTQPSYQRPPQNQPPQNQSPQQNPQQPQQPPRRTYPQQSQPQNQPPQQNQRPVTPQNPQPQQNPQQQLPRRPTPQQNPQQPQQNPRQPQQTPPQPQPRALPQHAAPNQQGSGGRVMPGGNGARQQRMDTARRRGN